VRARFGPRFWEVCAEIEPRETRSAKWLSLDYKDAKNNRVDGITIYLFQGGATINYLIDGYRISRAPRPKWHLAVSLTLAKKVARSPTRSNMKKCCLHIIKGGRCKDGIVSIFEVHINNSAIDRHIVLSILPIRHHMTINRDAEIFTLLSWRFDRLYFFLRRFFTLSGTGDLVIKTWGHASALLSVIFRWFSSAPVVWGIYDSGPGSQRVVALIVRCNRRYSYKVPFAIICGSVKALEEYRDVFSYDGGKLTYVGNACDPKYFHPESQTLNVKRSFNIPKESVVFGMVSRYCPEKGVDLYIQGMRRVLEHIPMAKFIFCGHRMDAHNRSLVRQLHEHGIKDSSILLGQRDDMRAVYNLLDVLVFPSYFKEGQSCCLIEAMSCGVLCVSSDTGDAAKVVGKAGIVLRENTPDSIAEACLRLIRMEPQEKSKLQRECRSRIEDIFDLETFIAKYDTILSQQFEKGDVVI